MSEGADAASVLPDPAVISIFGLVFSTFLTFQKVNKVGRCSLGSVILSYLNCKRFEIILVYFYLFIGFVCFNSNIWQH